ncbi:hypothetical protein SAMN05518672_113162 [Chitinophaga sp. CF118]|nr:hypothetical protein SAMN05518672_113162 [Chitinophaga sp. CF118]
MSFILYQYNIYPLLQIKVSINTLLIKALESVIFIILKYDVKLFLVYWVIT